MNLYQKLLKAQEAIGYVPKSGWNNFQKYEYVTEADLLDATRKALAEHGVALIMTGMTEETGLLPCAEGKEPKRWGKVVINYLLVNVDKPEETIPTNSVGYAEDGGDKAIYKAITGASKYLHYKLFMVSTGEDPERDEATKPEKKSVRNAQPKQPANAPPCGTGAPDPEAIKLQIRKAARTKGIDPKDVAGVAGVSSVWESSDPELLSNVLATLQAS